MTKPDTAIQQDRPLTASWPRSYEQYTGTEKSYPDFTLKSLPIPWINTSEVHRGKDWLAFDERALIALHEHDYNLCGICGCELGQYNVYGRWNDEGQEPVAGVSTGAGMHPRCALLSARTCPWLAMRAGLGSEPIFDMWVGDDCGIDFDEMELEEGVYEQSLYELQYVKLKDGHVPVSIEKLKELAKEEAQAKIAA